MASVITRLNRAATFVFLSVIMFPLLILGPFAYLSGFLAPEEFVSMFRSLPLMGAFFGSAIVVAFIPIFLTRPFSSSRDGDILNWKDLSKFGYRFFWTFLVLVAYQTTLSTLLLKFDIRISFPRMEIITPLLIVSFILMVNFPLYPILNKAIDNTIRSLDTKPNQIMSIRLKLTLIIGAVFVGTVLMFLVLEEVTRITGEIGRVQPITPVWLFVIAGLTALAFMVMTLSILTRYILQPLKHMVTTFSKGAGGDFRDVVPVTTSDEVGVLAAMANGLMDSLNSGFGTVTGSVEKLQISKNELGQRVEEIAGAIEEIRRNLTATNGQMEDHSANVVETTAAVEELARNIDSLGQLIGDQVGIIASSGRAVSDLAEANARLSELAGESRQKADGLVAVSRAGEEKLKVMAERIQAIMESSRHLLEANELIASVAGRTNLLAMNAAIEAAHAGDSGRGFAVVADEIRKLAETSSAQSTTITQNLKIVLDDIEKVGVESQAVQASFGQINTHVTDVGEAVVHMNNFTETVKSFGEQLEEALGNMTVVSEGVSTGSNEMQQGNQEILKAITAMREISQHVLEAVSEITIGADEITQLSAKMLEQDRDTDDSLNEVQNVLGRFKIRESRI